MVLHFFRSKKSILISSPFESPLVPTSSPDKSQWKITKLVLFFFISGLKFCFHYWQIICFVVWISIIFRDQRLHKLVFEDSGLPDGTEVGYYARGQVEQRSCMLFYFCFLIFSKWLTLVDRNCLRVIRMALQ